MRTLPEPDFIPRDPDAITGDLIARYEAQAGKTLYPAQTDRLLLDAIAYAKTNTHIAVQEAGKQLLARYARAPTLDYLGELIGITRLPAARSRAPMRFSIPASLPGDVAIPKGVVVGSKDGKALFETDEDVALSAGTLSVDVMATCREAGELGNGWTAGQISAIFSDLGSTSLSVANTGASVGGADAEDDERYRERVLEGPERLAAAGPIGAYRQHAMGAHQEIIDVGVVSPETTFDVANGVYVSTNDVPPGEVRVYPLTASGAPGADILDRVRAALRAETVRPLCDTVNVLSPAASEYVIRAALTLYKGADADDALTRAKAAANAHADAGARKLGHGVSRRHRWLSPKRCG